MKTRLTPLLLLCVLCIVCTSLMHAQTISPYEKITPPSPKAELFNRFSNYPVSYNTGMPDISIPLYVIKSGKLEIPVTLRYHIGNVRPGVDQSDIGLGWIIDVGGQVTRTIYGNPDDNRLRLPSQYFDTQLDQSVWDNLQHLDYCAGLDKQYDSEYDIFNFSFPGQSGEFIMDRDASGNFIAHVLSFKPLRFELIKQSSPYGKTGYCLGTIKITDSNGDIYTFGGNDATESCSSVNEAYGTTGWKLKSIVSADMFDIISFTYDRMPVFDYNNPQYGAGSIIDDRKEYCFRTAPDFCPPCPAEESCRGSSPENITHYEEVTIKEISFTSGRLVFGLSSDKSKIDYINIIDNQNKLIRKIQLYRSRFSSDSYNYLRLDSLGIFDSNQLQSQVYKFIYNTGVMSQSMTGTDYWGYYNGTYDGCTKRTYTSFEDMGSCNIMGQKTKECFNGIKTPDIAASQAQTLKKVIYPTKGETEFFFENNTYSQINDASYSGPEITGGGLRIASIIDRDGSGSQVKRTFQYEGGFIEHSFTNPANYNTTYYSIVKEPNTSTENYFVLRNRSFSNTINGELGDNRINYKKVTEFFGEPFGVQNTGKTIYYYEYPNSNEYSYYSSGIPNDIGRKIMAIRRNWDNGPMYRKEVFKINSNGAYDTVQVEKNHYAWNLDNYLDFKSMKIFRLTTFPVSNLVDEYYLKLNMRDGFGLPPDPMYSLFGSYFYYIQTGSFYLVSKESIDYFKNPDNTTGRVTTMSRYYYDNSVHKQLTRVETVNSKGDEIKTYTYYPQDYQGTTLFSGLIAKNIVASVIDLRTYVGGKLTHGKLVKYDETGNPTETYYARNELGTALQFTPNTPYSYGDLTELLDYGPNNKLRQYHLKDNIKSTYLWGYNNAYPVIKAENIDYVPLNAAVSSLQSNFESFLTATVGNLATDAQKNAWKQFNTSLRDNPSLSKAMVTTCTYSPLVGMTSQTDPNGVTTYYEYDDFNRLKCIKDDDGHILKTYDYHYKE